MEENKIEKLAEEFADSHERRGCAYWNGLYRGYIAGIAQQDVIKSVCEHPENERTYRRNALVFYCHKCEEVVSEQTVL